MIQKSYRGRYWEIRIPIGNPNSVEGLVGVPKPIASDY